MESLISFSGTLWTHEEFTIPEISKSHYLMAEKVGHPLIPENQRITNVFEMSKPGSVCIITGSNMSGKSTFLRTIGVNMVLALSGGPVCADRATFPYMAVFSSMRTADNLAESTSSFYAELKRLKMLLDLIESSETPVFYLLDEVLKGTNSKDRHRGAESLIVQLSKMQAMGFVSTHDLKLGELEQSVEPVSNFSFSSCIEDDEIKFDYKICPGICKSFNASELMEKMGILRA